MTLFVKKSYLWNLRPTESNALRLLCYIATIYGVINTTKEYQDITKTPLHEQQQHHHIIILVIIINNYDHR